MLVKLTIIGGLYRPPEARELEDGHLEIDINTFDALVDLLNRNQLRRECAVELRSLRPGETHGLVLTVYGNGDVYAPRPDTELRAVSYQGEEPEPEEDLDREELDQFNIQTQANQAQRTPPTRDWPEGNPR